MIKEILYGSDSINVAVFHCINGIQGELFDQAMLLGSSIGNYKLFPLYVVIIILFTLLRGKAIAATNDVIQLRKFRHKMAETVIFLILSYIIYLGWVHGLKAFLHMPRPFVMLPEGTVHIMDKVKFNENPMTSFPSGHAAFSMLMLVGLWPVLNKPWRIAGVLILLWIGFSRIALGVHFPSDVVFSWALSFIIVTLTAKFAVRIVSIIKLLFFFLLFRYFRILP